MNPTLCKILNIIACICLVIGLIGNFRRYHSWNFIINGILKLVLVIILGLLEFRQTPGLVKPFSFMFYFLGRGLFYLFLGLMPMGSDRLSVISGFIIAVIGIIYIIFHFAKPNGEPEFMSFARYQRLTSGLSHELPTNAATSQNTYPVAHQVPLSPQGPANGAASNGQYNTTYNIPAPMPPAPMSPAPMSPAPATVSNRQLYHTSPASPAPVAVSNGHHHHTIHLSPASTITDVPHEKSEEQTKTQI